MGYLTYLVARYLAGCSTYADGLYLLVRVCLTLSLNAALFAPVCNNFLHREPYRLL